MTTKVTVKIDRPAVKAMTGTPEGMVSRYMDDLVKKIVRRAKVHTPRRSTRLRQSYSSRVSRRSGTTVVHRIRNKAPYAQYVFEGTQGPITSTSGKLMPVGASQRVNAKIAGGKSGRRPIRLKRQVAGQPANNAPMKGVDDVFATEGL